MSIQQQVIAVMACDTLPALTHNNKLRLTLTRLWSLRLSCETLLCRHGRRPRYAVP